MQVCDQRQARATRIAAWLLAAALTLGALACSIDSRLLTMGPDGGNGGTTVVGTAGTGGSGGTGIDGIAGTSGGGDSGAGGTTAVSPTDGGNDASQLRVRDPLRAVDHPVK